MNSVPDRLNVKFAGPEVMKSVYNIWKIPERGGKPVQVTRHSSGNLSFPSMSADGKTIVYEENFGLWKLDVASGKSKEIPIHITSDVKENEADVRAAGNFGNRSLIVLASRQQMIPGPQNAKEVQEWNDWRVNTEQQSLARLATRGRLVVVDNHAGPESIVAAVRDVVTEIRGKPNP